MAAATVLQTPVPIPEYLPPSTPADYHRIVSKTLTIPTEPDVTIPVGILACQRVSCSALCRIAHTEFVLHRRSSGSRPRYDRRFEHILKARASQDLRIEEVSYEAG